ncbi:unnamed protein product [Prunus brigantina]
MWDFVQVTVVVTRVMGSSFGNLGASAGAWHLGRISSFGMREGVNVSWIDALQENWVFMKCVARTKSHVLFLFKASISTFMASIHLGLDKASCSLLLFVQHTAMYGVANLAAWCSGPRGCAQTRDVLLLDAVRLCAGVPARSTMRRDGDGVWVEDFQMMRLFGVGLLIK